MAQKEKYTMRQKVAMDKRDDVLSSQAFKTWWDARQSFTPTPSDPYRAFMIDNGLYAKPHVKDVWKHRTNRLDLPPIDDPKGKVKHTRTNTKDWKKKPSKRDLSFLSRYKKVPKAAQPHKATKMELKMSKKAKQMIKRYKMEGMEIVFQVRKGAAYSSISNTGYLKSKGKVLMPARYAKSAEQSKFAMEQLWASMGHELGHGTHDYLGGKKQSSLPKELRTISGLKSHLNKKYDKHAKLRKESTAWKVAKAYTKKHKPVSKKGWTKTMRMRQSYMIGSYLQNTSASDVKAGYPKWTQGKGGKMVYDFDTGMVTHDVLGFNVSAKKTRQKSKKKKVKRKRKRKR